MKATRLFAAVFALLATDVLAADQPPGAAACTGCHAINARTNTSVPRIQGRSAADIVAAMMAFKSGSRASTVMDRIAKGFNENESQAIAVWFAGQK